MKSEKSDVSSVEDLSLVLELDQENLVKALKALLDAGVEFKLKEVGEKRQPTPVWVPSVFSWPNTIRPTWNPQYSPDTFGPPVGSPWQGPPPGTTTDPHGGMPWTVTSWGPQTLGDSPSSSSAYTHPETDKDFEQTRIEFDPFNFKNSYGKDSHEEPIQVDDLYGIDFDADEIEEILCRVNDLKKIRGKGFPAHEETSFIRAQAKSRKRRKASGKAA